MSYKSASLNDTYNKVIRYRKTLGMTNKTNDHYSEVICFRCSKQLREFLEFLKDYHGYDTLSDVIRDILETAMKNMMLNYPILRVEMKKWKFRVEE